MRVAILSDIHGNLEALNSILNSFPDDLEGLILLGDIIDYGPHSNEVISIIQEIKYPIICNIWGNHEKAVLTESYDRFSSERGSESAKHTHDNLNQKTWDYLKNNMIHTGQCEFYIDGKRCLSVHGSLEDMYWKAIDKKQDLKNYRDYAYVFSGHSHFSHVFEEYYDSNDSKLRYKKKTVFINPGSVGQPRNHNPNSQYAVLDTLTGEVQLKCIPYDIKKEQQAFSSAIDSFYRERLGVGV